MTARRRLRDLFWPLAVLGGGAIILLVVSLVAFAWQADNAAQAREESVVSAGIAARAQEVGAPIIANAVWDEAVRSLDNQFNLQWASDNVGQFAHVTLGYQIAYVLNAQDRAIYGMEHGQDVPTERYTRLENAAHSLVAQVRQAEAERQNQPNSGVLSTPIQAGAVKNIGERYYILTATLVQSDFGAATIQSARAPIILTGRELDEQFMAEFSGRYMLDGAHVHDGDARNLVEDGREAHAPITDESGVVVATIDWNPQAPGTELLFKALPWTISLLVVLFVGALSLYRRARRTAHDLIESEERAQHIAFTDALTGIPNRAWFEREMGSAFHYHAKTREAFAVLCIDLDRFKELNDIYGHPVGDELLKQVAARLKEVCGDHGECARLGGDEFAILQLPSYGNEADALAASIVSALSTPFSLSVGPKLIGCSVGVTVAQGDVTEPLELLRRADLALYRAKAMGRGRFCAYTPDLDADFKHRRFLMDHFRTAIADGDLSMVYQPQVDRTGKVIGVESLVRWNHPELGAISPATFVPLAEEAGLISALGDFTLRQAFLDSRRWPGMKVAVNVSATQLQTPGFALHVRQLARDTSVNPADIEIELTEGVLLADDESTKATLKLLREAGFSLALDDFGTGYSSLSYLRRFPITKIKIDRSFVMNLGIDSEADAVVGAIVKLAQALDLGVIAEGVETNEQWLRLMAAGCMEIQGFIASEPLSAEAMGSIIETSPQRMPQPMQRQNAISVVRTPR